MAMCHIIIRILTISVTAYHYRYFTMASATTTQSDSSQVSLPTKGTELTPSFEEISTLAQNQLSQVGALCDISMFPKWPCIATVEA